MWLIKVTKSASLKLSTMARPTGTGQQTTACPDGFQVLIEGEAPDGPSILHGKEIKKF